jgi:hypothetical protein
VFYLLPTRPADLILDPINTHGSNICGERESENHYFVQLIFYIRSTEDAEILNIDFDYGDSRYLTIQKDVLVDREDVGVDIYYKLQSPISLRQGQARRITVIKRFPLEPPVEDYGNVLILADVNFPTQRGIIHKEWKFRLAPGGELQPVAA